MIIKHVVKNTMRDLLPRSSDQSQKEIDMGLVDIMGVVVQLIRNV